MGLPIVTLAALYLFGKLKVARPLVLTTTALGIFGAALAQVLAHAVGLGSNYGVAKHIFPVATMTALVIAVLMANAVAPWLEKRLPAFPRSAAARSCWRGSQHLPCCFRELAAGSIRCCKSRRLSPSTCLRAAEGARSHWQKTLLPLEEFRLVRRGSGYPKNAGVIRIIHPDRDGAADILAKAPVTYVVVALKTSPPLSDDCTVVGSAGAPGKIVTARCVGRDGVYPLGEWITLCATSRSRVSQIRVGPYRIGASGVRDRAPRSRFPCRQFRQGIGI